MSALPQPRRAAPRHLALVRRVPPTGGTRWGFVLRGVLTTLLIGAAVTCAAVLIYR